MLKSLGKFSEYDIIKVQLQSAIYYCVILLSANVTTLYHCITNNDCSHSDINQQNSMKLILSHASWTNPADLWWLYGFNLDQSADWDLWNYSAKIVLLGTSHTRGRSSISWSTKNKEKFIKAFLNKGRVKRK